MKDEAELFTYILMKRILPEEHFNYIITPYNTDAQRMKCASEIGIFGISIGYDIFAVNCNNYKTNQKLSS